MQLKKLSYLIGASVVALGLTGCFDNNDSDWVAEPPESALPALPILPALPVPPNLRFAFGMQNTREIANNGNIPLPNDLYFLDKAGVKQSRLIVMGCGATDIGDETKVENATKCSLEALDGWSTTAPFSLPLTGDLSALDTRTLADGIQIVANGDSLKYDEDFTVRVTAFGHLQILPLKVFRPQTVYTLIITRALMDLSGIPVGSSDAYRAEKSKQTVYAKHINDVEAVIAQDYGIESDEIVYAARFTTQSIGGELLALDTNANPPSFEFDSSTSRKYAVNGFLPGCFGGKDCVEKLSGTLQLPNYLPSTEDIGKNCVADLKNQEEAEFWYEFYGATAQSESFKYTKESCPGLYEPMDFSDKSTTAVAVSMVIPPKPKTGGPLSLNVMIAAHGITAIKELGNGGMLIMDNFVQPKVASQAKPVNADGYATVAIDHVYHGTRSINLNFDCDGDKVAEEGCFENSPGARPVGAYDISVSSAVSALIPNYARADVKNFLKIDALLTSRDNFRKVVADILNLKAAIAHAVDTSGKVQLYPNISIYGHSMGAIAATTASGIEQIKWEQGVGQQFAGTILANPGGGIGGIVMNSVWLGKDEVPPAIKFLPEFRLRMAKELGIEGADEQALLAAVREYAETRPEAFLARADEISPQYLAESQYLIQSVVDTVDPLNYAGELQDRTVLSMTAVGNAHKNPDMVDYEGKGFTAADQTVPIKVERDTFTTFTRCASAAVADSAIIEDAVLEGENQTRESVSNNLTCTHGTEQVPYYSLDITEFPLSGAEPLEQALGLRDVREGTPRSASRITEGNHNIGVGALPDGVSEGTKNGKTVGAAATEVVAQTVQFMSDEFGVVNKVNTDLLPPL